MVSNREEGQGERTDSTLKKTATSLGAQALPLCEMTGQMGQNKNRLSSRDGVWGMPPASECCREAQVQWNTEGF